MTFWRTTCPRPLPRLRQYSPDCAGESHALTGGVLEGATRSG